MNHILKKQWNEPIFFLLFLSYSFLSIIVLFD